MFLAHLLLQRREAIGTRAGRRALSPWSQAALVLRWFLDGTRIAQLAEDNEIGLSTCYRYLHEEYDTTYAKAADGLLPAFETLEADQQMPTLTDLGHIETTFKALRRVSLRPWRISAISKAALGLLHLEHDRHLPRGHPA
jgi:hypothetical protein